MKKYEVTGIATRTFVVDCWAENEEAAKEWFDTHPDELFNDSNLIEQYDEDVVDVTEVAE